jgi:hypothetical protein
MRSTKFWLFFASVVLAAVAALLSYRLLRPSQPQMQRHALTGYVLEVTPYSRNNGFNGYGQHALTGIEPMTPRRCILVGEHEGDWQKFRSDDRAQQVSCSA